MPDSYTDPNFRHAIFGFGEGIRRISSRPQKVRGPIPWDDARWWALRRYRPVLAEGPVVFGPWQLTVPAACRGRWTRDATLEFADGDLTVVVRRTPAEPSPGVPDVATRWARGPVVGASWVEGTPPAQRFEHELGADGVERLRIHGASANPHDRHWVSALVQSVELVPPDPVPRALL